MALRTSLIISLLAELGRGDGEGVAWYCPKDSCLLKVASGKSAASYRCLFLPYNGRQCGDQANLIQCPCDGHAKFGDYTAWSEEKEVNGTINCSISVFGDPAPDKYKFCWCSFREQDVREAQNVSVAACDASPQGQCDKDALAEQGYDMSSPASCIALDVTVDAPAGFIALANMGVVHWFTPQTFAPLLPVADASAIRLLRPTYAARSTATLVFPVPTGLQLQCLLDDLAGLKDRGDELGQSAITYVDSFNDPAASLVVRQMDIRVKEMSPEIPAESGFLLPCQTPAPSPTPTPTPGNRPSSTPTPTPTPVDGSPRTPTSAEKEASTSIRPWPAVAVATALLLLLLF
eukprot:TRINITY_DN103255_c0_g1_i1.p1 TRINITY_DN103255_c0_g1~~TRINITY_DN103255_c0_g1_i1.p1  ORF type:complete len:347 (+),score=46.54 TRINITY_DN103255_c0_g1_i1:181-1221(+)